jgi:hypothetical protein
MERNFDTLKFGRWYLNRARTGLVKIVSVDNHEDFPFKGGDDNQYSSKGNYLRHNVSQRDLIYEFPEGWDQMVVGSLMEVSKKPQYDRDEVLRMTLDIYKLCSHRSSAFADYVQMAIELINAVNECMKGGSNAIR